MDKKEELNVGMTNEEKATLISLLSRLNTKKTKLTFFAVVRAAYSIYRSKNCPLDGTIYHDYKLKDHPKCPVCQGWVIDCDRLSCDEAMINFLTYSSVEK